MMDKNGSIDSQKFFVAHWLHWHNFFELGRLWGNFRRNTCILGQNDPIVKSSDPGKRQKVTKTDRNVYQYILINYSSSHYGLHPILVGLNLTWAKKYGFG